MEGALNNRHEGEKGREKEGETARSKTAENTLKKVGREVSEGEIKGHEGHPKIGTLRNTSIKNYASQRRGTVKKIQSEKYARRTPKTKQA